MNEDKRFYGIYEGICTNNQDPDKKYKIKLKVTQILGDSETDWASPCLPVNSDADHLDHLAHTATQVAALLTTSSANDGGVGASSHNHTVQALGSGTLTHPHIVSTDALETDGSELGLTAAEHTYHRKIPNVGQKVWIMFIAGDPNYPVWMGVEL
jgi:hypothetical protein